MGVEEVFLGAEVLPLIEEQSCLGVPCCSRHSLCPFRRHCCITGHCSNQYL